ncbi:protein LDOC1-like [Ambystoma mexicanum]|uniref:protein LDOC1-like n=1 Tax=Ambystoma mexicanum TaxID=8296 RepID=UPI0037E84F01
MEQQMQQLMAAMQSMSLEMQSLKQDNAQLKQQFARDFSETPPVTLSTGKYDGDPHRLKEFLDSCTIQFTFKSRFFPTDKDKVGFLISHLTGPALAWATPLVISGNAILDSYPAFSNSLRSMFGRQEISVATQERLLDLRQGHKDLMSWGRGLEAM